MRQLQGFDRAIVQFDKMVRSLVHKKSQVAVPNTATTPKSDLALLDNSQSTNTALSIEKPSPLTESETKHSAALMRINHCGEVCAQALYLGQALTARDPKLTQQLYQAAAEEGAHLRWCRNRIAELKGKRSILNPLFAAGSFAMGVGAGLLGDKISLGFLAETEEQVTEHLNKHLAEISNHDKKSKTIMLQMQADEQRHANHAIELGGIALPKPIGFIMKGLSKVMTTLTRFI